jgi:hypothetical protein
MRCLHLLSLTQRRHYTKVASIGQQPITRPKTGIRQTRPITTRCLRAFAAIL